MPPAPYVNPEDLADMGQIHERDHYLLDTIKSISIVMKPPAD